MNMPCVVLVLMMSSASAFSNEPLPAASHPPASTRPASMSEAECVVWSRELGFARSVEAHDPVAFAEYLHPGTVFGAGTPTPVRGRAAVAADWKDIIAGKSIILRWHPGFVSIGGDPRIALSSGPAWIENPDPKASPRFTISRFTSTWVKDTDGQWRVLFDGAGAPPKPASADEVATLVAQQSAICPRT